MGKGNGNRLWCGLFSCSIFARSSGKIDKRIWLAVLFVKQQRYAFFAFSSCLWLRCTALPFYSVAYFNAPKLVCILVARFLQPFFSYCIMNRELEGCCVCSLGDWGKTDSSVSKGLMGVNGHGGYIRLTLLLAEGSLNGPLSPPFLSSARQRLWERSAVKKAQNKGGWDGWVCSSYTFST